jgi:hypothetical protein
MPEDYDVEDVFEFDSNDFKDVLSIVYYNLFGASIFLCHKKALISAKHIKYIPKVLFRYS